MKYTLPFITSILILLFNACDSSQNTTENVNSNPQIDTTNAVKIGDYWAIPKQSFNFNSLEESGSDTLKLVTCADFVYSPFGEINKKSDLNNGLLKNFKAIDRIDTIYDDTLYYQVLTLNNNRLILFVDSENIGTRHSYILKGEVLDKEANFVEGIRIGMSKEDFIQTFFEEFQSNALKQYDVYVLISCVQGIDHTYTFVNGKLKSVNFRSDSYLPVKY